MELGTGQRRIARYGLPRVDADAAPRGADRTAAGAPGVTQSNGRSDPARTCERGRVAAADGIERPRPAGVAPGAAHVRGGPVQQPAQAPPLPGLRAARG